MDADLKKILKAVVLEMRHELEGYYDNAGKWYPGDLETRLAEIGVRKDRASVHVDELGRLTYEDVRARKVVDAFIDVREQAGVDRSEAVAEYIRESAYTWANRLVALRCMEARELLDDEVIVGREAYGGRSLVHHRLAQTSPELCASEDDGRFAMLAQVFAERANTLPMLFDPDSPSIALRPSPAALKNCLAWLSGTQRVRSQEPATDAVFAAPDALGWAYQYWNTEEKDRVFETVRTKKGAKIEGADIVPATQLYTEDYMVKFLVQNSLGATWMAMYPDSKLSEGWEYYVRDADRAPAKKKPLQQITLLDPACGSGHFLIDAFDMFYAMYEEEGTLKDPELICKSILENNLFGIDIDERAIQIAEASLWMKAEEKAFGFSGANTNLVAATSSHLKGESWERFLTTLDKEPHIPRVLREFAKSIENIDELGSLARPHESLQEIVKAEHEVWEQQERERHQGGNFLFKELRDDLLASQLPFQDISDKEFFERTMRHALFAIDGFTKDARNSGEFNDQLMGAEAKTGFRLLGLLSRHYDIVVANPPYVNSSNMGEVLRQFTEAEYTIGRRDLFSAFILRGIALTNPHARFAAVVPQSWLFLSGFEDFRGGNEKSQGLLNLVCLETLVQLARHAFEEVDPATNACLFTFCNSKPQTSHRITCYRVGRPMSASFQAELLRHATRSTDSENCYRPYQSIFEYLPGKPICFWATDQMLKQMKDGVKIGDLATVPAGLTTGDSERFVRFHWETEYPHRWMRLAHGGPFRRWVGNETHVLRWGNGWREVIREFGNQLPNEALYGAQGITVSQGAIGILGFRLMENSAFSNSAMVVIPNDGQKLHFLLGFLNTRVASVFVRLFSKKFGFEASHLSAVPADFDKQYVNDVEYLVGVVVNLTAKTVELDPREWRCTGLLQRWDIKSRFASTAIRHTLEAVIEAWVREASKLTQETCKLVDAETELHVGNYNMIVGYRVLEVLDIVPKEVTSKVRDFIAAIPTVELSADEVAKLKRRIIDLSTGSYQENDETDDSVEVQERSRLSYDPESLIESVCRDVRYHPISVYGLLLEIAEDSPQFADWECQSFQRDNVTIVILGLCGYRWPEQQEMIAHNSQSETQDTIIPLTPFPSKATLHERVVKSFDAANIEPWEYSHVEQKTLESWLQSSFFAYHVKRFRKRPLIWQVQSSAFTGKRSPVFACILYANRVTGEAVAKLRAEYIGPLRVRLETELRSISTSVVSERSDRQSRRTVELEEAINELQSFDKKIESVVLNGFGPYTLTAAIRQFAFDDAMLAMKWRWLARLSKLLKNTSDEDSRTKDGEWIYATFSLQRETLNSLHISLGKWIAESLAHLENHCSLVGAKSPIAAKTEIDPTVEYFAKLIQTDAQEMVSKSIELACDIWYAKFAEAELKSRKEQVKAFKEEQKALKEQIKRLKELRDKGIAEVDSQDEEPFALQQKSIDGQLSYMSPADRVKQLAAEIKLLEQELKKIEAAVGAIRKSITNWSSDEPFNWGEWLAASQMFDQISSLDERRAPPKTIADFIAQESLYAPNINDGIRVNIAPLQKAGLLATDVLAAKDVDKAIADRAEWRADERRWVREGKLPQPGWWAQPQQVMQKADVAASILAQQEVTPPGRIRPDKMDDTVYSLTVLKEMVLLRPDGIELIHLAEAFSLLAEKDQLLDSLKTHAAVVDESSASHWHTSFNQKPNAQFLKEYFKELQTRKLADYKDGKFIPGTAAMPKIGWARYDASLALAAVEAMPQSLRDEILEPNIKEMVVSLRLVG